MSTQLNSIVTDRDRGRCARLAVVIALAALVGLAPAAQASWSAGVDVSEPGSYGSFVALDSDGDGWVVWKGYDGETDRLLARRISSSGTLGPIRTLSHAGWPGTWAFDVGGDGDAMVLWGQKDDQNITRIYGRQISRTGAFGPILMLSSPPYGENDVATEPSVAVDRDGDAVVVWRERAETGGLVIRARRITRTGTVGPIQTVDADGQRGINPQVATDSEGVALVVWQRMPGTRLNVRRILRDGSLGYIRRLSAAGHAAHSPQIAVNDDGDAVVTWQDDDVDGVVRRINARRIWRFGTFGPIQTIWSDNPEGIGTGLGIAIDQDGIAVVVWARHDASNYRIRARRLMLHGGIGRTRTLSWAGQSAFNPRVAVDQDGDAIVVWERPDYTGTRRVQVRPISSAGVLGSIRTLSAPAIEASGVGVAIDEAGDDAVAVWTLEDDYTIQAAFGP